MLNEAPIPTFIEKPTTSKNTASAMDVDIQNNLQQSGSGSGPNTGTRQDATEYRDSSSQRNNHITFKKTHISTELKMFKNKKLWLCTILFKSRWIWYAKILKVFCQVTPLGTRTAFDVGSTISGTATSEYVPIVLVAKALNKEFYGRNVAYTIETTDPMKVTANTINVREMYEKYYKHIPSNALCIPQSIDEYFVHECNREKSPDEKKFLII